jgi:peroxiredoxin
LCSLLITVGFLLAGCAAPLEQPTPEETTLTQVGQVAPVFELEITDSGLFSLHEQKGKVVLINFFATWCPPCREELPALEKEIWQRFQGRELAVLVIGRGHNNDEILPFLKENGYSFPAAGDPERAVYDLYASRFIPRNVVVGPDGTILFQSSGYDREEFEHMVDLIATTLDGIEATDGAGVQQPS